jgi:hypothetical protein
MYIKLLLMLICLIVISTIVYQILLANKIIGKNNKSKTAAFLSKTGSTDYLKKDDPNAQVLYEKNKILDYFSLNIKNKLELSWQFLYDITDIVLKKFSSQDKNTLLELGKKLLRCGMQYEHVIDYGINREKLQKNSKIKSSEVSR